MGRRADYLDKLLGRDRLSGPAREQILRQALKAAGVAPLLPWWRRARLGWWVPAVAGVTALVLLIHPRQTHDGFAPKGSGLREPVVEVGCLGGSALRCRTGEPLIFRVAGADAGGYLAAYAEPVGASGGQRVWYFPTAGAAAAQVAAQAEPQTLRQAARLGSEQPPGRYQVHLVLSRRPLTREEALAARGPEVIAATQVLLEVTR